MKLCKIVGLLILSFLITQSMKDIVYSQTECQFEQELQTYTNPIKIEDVNINTIIIGNFLTRIGEKSYKELIYGTFNSRILIRDSATLEYRFSIEVESNAKGIRVKDLNPNDSQIKYNELIFWDENNNLYVYDNNLDSLFEKKIEYPIVDITFLDADNDNKIDIVVATKNGIYTFNGKGNLIWENSRFNKIEGILTLNFLEQKQNNKEEIIAITQNKLLIYGYNGGFIESIDFTPEIIKDFKIWKESGKDCLIVLTHETKNKISRVYKVSEIYEGRKYWIYGPKENIKNIFPIDSKIYTGVENDFAILCYKNNLEMIATNHSYQSNEPLWKENFNNNIMNIENFDLEGHLIDSEEKYYSIINDNKEIIITTDSGDIGVYYWDRNDQEMKCYSKFQRKEDIQEKIVFSRILDLDYSSYRCVIQVSENNMVYPMRIFEKECELIKKYKGGISAYEDQDYREAKDEFEECIGKYKENIEIFENYYHKIYTDCIEKQNIIEEESKKIVPEADEKLKNGIKLFNLEKYPSALNELFNAYQKYEEAGFRDQKVLDKHIIIENEDVEEFKFADLERLIHYLNLSILKEADEELKNENYESAIEKFIAVYPIFERLVGSVRGVIRHYEKEDKRFSQFKPLEEEYNTTYMIKNIIEDQCFKNLEEDAQSLMNESKYKEAKLLYEKLDGYRERMGEEEDSNKRAEYEEKIRICELEIYKTNIIKTFASIVIGYLILGIVMFISHRRKFRHIDIWRYYRKFIILYTEKPLDKLFAIFSVIISLLLIHFIIGVEFEKLKYENSIFIFLIVLCSMIFFLDSLLSFIKFALTYDESKEREGKINRYIREIKGGESQEVEFKLQIDPKFSQRLAKEIAGFANTNNGKIFIGVDDETNIAGVSDCKKLKDRIDNICKDIDPPIIPKYDVFQYEGKELLVIIIEKSDMIHLLKDGRLYIRSNATTRPATYTEFSRM